MARRNGIGPGVGKTTLARHGFSGLLSAHGAESEHVLSRLLRERGGDEAWADGMVAEISKPGWCPTCKCGRSPAMYRTYARVRNAERNGLADLAEAVDALQAHREAVEQAEGMDDAAVEARAVRWLARYHAVPEAVLREAIAGARDGNLARMASVAGVVAGPAPRQANGNGPRVRERGRA